MRHRKSGRQFSRNTSHRRAMFRALAANLFAHEAIETTDAKAKELRRIAERLITRAKRLGAVASCHADDVGPAGNGVLGQSQQIVTGLEDDRLDAALPTPGRKVELLGLATTRPRIHEQHGTNRKRNRRPLSG